MSPAVTGPGPFLCRRSSALSRECMRSATVFRFRRTSTTSSCTPSMLVYSWSTPSISTSVMALPGIEDSSTRRSALPSVWPKPRSNGSITTRAWRGATGCTFTTRGLRNSLTEPCIAVSPCRLTHDRRKRKVGPPYMGAAGTRCKWTRLLRIQLDDQVLIDVGQDVVPARRRLEQATELLVVHLDPLGQADLLRDVQRALDAQLLARSLAHLDDVPGLHLERGDGDRLVVHGDRLVAHQLARLGARGREAHAIHHVVQPALEQLQQVLAGGTAPAGGFVVVVAELPLEHPVHAAQFLLLAQLQAVVGQARAALTLDAPRRHAELALVFKRLDAALQEQIRALAAGELACGTNVTRHIVLVKPLDPALLGWTAAIVRNWWHVRDAGDLQSAMFARAPRPLTSRSRSPDPYFHVLHAVLLGGDTGLLGRHLRRERSALARATEAAAPGGRPGERVALPIGDGDDRVVEGGMHVRDRIEHVLARLLRSLGRRGCRRRGAGLLGFLALLGFLTLLGFLALLGFLLLSHSLCLSGRCVQLDRLLARALAGARVGARALAAHRQSASMTDPAVAAQVHQPFDVHRHLAAQVALDREPGDLRADCVDLRLGEILHLGGGVDARGRAGGARARSAHAVDVREPDPHVLVHRDVDTSYACHVCLTSTLTLLVPRVRAYDVHDAAAAHDLAVLADLLDRRTHFHDWPPEPLRP